VSVFTPDRLHEKINGRAELYLRFHVVSLTFGSYRHSVNGEQTIDVYWYDMGEAENAFGIYETESPPGAASLEIGHGGYQAGGAVFFVKDSSYVQVLPSGVDAADADAALEIARLIAEVAGSEPRP
ncbi:MAG: DUF6599 family protein, partial [Planctomycetota bacterium]